MTITCRLISETVAQSYGITVRDLNSRRVERGIVLPRHMSWTLAKRLTERSLPEIGRFMGGRDHTTVIHGIRKIEGAIDTDPQIAANYAQLVDIVTTLGETSDKGDRMADRFHDLDPLETAEQFLEAKFRDVVPSMEAIRSLCMGIQHYAVELERLQAFVDNQADLWIQEKNALEDRLANLALGTSRSDPALAAAATVVARLKALDRAVMTVNERPARKALEASLKALQTTFERN